MLSRACTFYAVYDSDLFLFMLKDRQSINETVMQQWLKLVECDH